MNGAIRDLVKELVKDEEEEKIDVLTTFAYTTTNKGGINKNSFSDILALNSIINLKIKHNISKEKTLEHLSILERFEGICGFRFDRWGNAQKKLDSKLLLKKILDEYANSLMKNLCSKRFNELDYQEKRYLSHAYLLFLKYGYDFGDTIEKDTPFQVHHEGVPDENSLKTKIKKIILKTEFDENTIWKVIRLNNELQLGKLETTSFSNILVKIGSAYYTPYMSGAGNCRFILRSPSFLWGLIQEKFEKGGLPKVKLREGEKSRYEVEFSDRLTQDHADLVDYVRNRLSNRGLYIPSENGGVEYPAGSKKIDLLCKDKYGGYVVIEVKSRRAGSKAVGQVLGYIGWVKNQSFAKDNAVRGIVIAEDSDHHFDHARELVDCRIDFIKPKNF